MKERKNKLAIIAFFAIAGLCLLFFIGAIPYIAKSVFIFFSTGWLRGVIFTILFIFLQFNLRRKDADFLTICLLFFVYTFIVVLFDIEGNELFNKPLEWMTQSLGTLHHSITDVESFGGRTSWNITFQILQSNGNVITIPIILVLLYRAIQYVAWFVVIGYVNEKTFVKLMPKIKIQYYKHSDDTIDADMKEKIAAEMQKREEAKQKKEVSDELYMRIKTLKEKGDTIEAIKLLRDETNGTWTLQEAKDFVDTI